MTIKEVCEKFDITADTLRYYERVGVTPPVSRTAGGIRDYREEDIAWVENAICFRDAGMPVEMTPGTVINIPANVKHWHGAADDSWFSHLAIEIAGEEASTEWCEKV